VRARFCRFSPGPVPALGGYYTLTPYELLTELYGFSYYAKSDLVG